MKTLLSILAKLPAILEFAAYYLFEVVASNLRVAHDVLTPTHYMKPEIIRVGIEGLTDRQVLALGNLVTMTPGTLSLDVDENQRELVVHGMYVDDPAAAARELEADFLRRIRRVF